MLKKFGHFLMNSSRDTGGGASGAPPVRGKDILIPYGIGLSNLRSEEGYVVLNSSPFLVGAVLSKLKL